MADENEKSTNTPVSEIKEENFSDDKKKGNKGIIIIKKE